MTLARCVRGVVEGDSEVLGSAGPVVEECDECDMWRVLVLVKTTVMQHRAMTSRATCGARALSCTRWPLLNCPGTLPWPTWTISGNLIRMFMFTCA